MGVIIDTASKVVDKFAAGVHGFDAGDPQTGRDPTALSDDWCDGVQQELNSAIEISGITLDNADRDQLAESIDEQITYRYGRFSARTNTWRSHSSGGGGTTGSWLRQERSSILQGVASNTVQNLLGMTMPSNSQATMVLRGSIVRTDLMTAYGNVISHASIVNNAGVYTIQSSNNSTLQDITVGGLIIVPVIVGAAIYLRFTIPVAVGKFWNIMVSGSLENVSW
jgi:hypothetical protein